MIPSEDRYSRLVQDLGPPIAYTVLEDGTPVYDRNGKRIGVVDHVLADMQLDIFEGLVVHILPLPGRHVFADADQIDELHERGVAPVSRARRSARAARRAPREARGQRRPGREPARGRLRRAWDWIAGRH